MAGLLLAARRDDKYLNCWLTSALILDSGGLCLGL